MKDKPNKVVPYFVSTIYDSSEYGDYVAMFIKIDYDLVNKIKVAQALAASAATLCETNLTELKFHHTANIESVTYYDGKMGIAYLYEDVFDFALRANECGDVVNDYYIKVTPEGDVTVFGYWKHGETSDFIESSTDLNVKLLEEALQNESPR